MRGGRNIACLLLASVLAVPAIAQTTPGAGMASTQLSSSASQAAKTVDAFHAALHAGNQAEAAGLLANDALVYESGGAERSKAEYASHHLPADIAFAKATSRSVTRRSGHTSDDLAWIATESTTTGTYRDRAINSVSTETMVLRREAGTWRIAHIHWSSANVK